MYRRQLWKIEIIRPFCYMFFKMLIAIRINNFQKGQIIIFTNKDKCKNIMEIAKLLKNSKTGIENSLRNTE